MASNPKFGWVKMSPAQLRAAGYSPKSKRYMRSSVKHVTSKIQTISERQAVTKKRQLETGQRLSREKVSKQLRKGAIKYKSKRAERMAKFTIKSNEIKRQIYGVTKSDIKLIMMKQQRPWDDFPDKAKEAYRGLFNKYSRAEVLEAVYDTSDPIEPPDNDDWDEWLGDDDWEPYEEDMAA